MRASHARLGRMVVSQTVPEFNGARLVVAGRPEVWLVFFGVRHHISGPLVYDALFYETDGLVAVDSIDHIQRGADLNEGTCLVRAEGDAGIYLVTGFPDTEIRRHYTILRNIYLFRVR